MLVVAVAGVVLFVAVALVGVGGLVVAQRQAQAAADLAALAGAVAAGRGEAGCAAAARVAAANDARLLACRVAGREVRVTVRVDGPGVGEGPLADLDVAAQARAGPAAGP